jgi:phosphatidylcholine synthase
MPDQRTKPDASRLPPSPGRPSGDVRGSPFAAWIGPALVHAFTASGAVCALFATLAVLEGAYSTAFAWLGLALFIDGIDGTFARMLDVRHRLPRFSGDKLDLVVDYVTYVFVPVLALLQSKLLSGNWGLVFASLILMTSLFHFADNASKTADHCFVGFPAIWNVVAFYLFAIPLPAWGAYGLILACALLTFVPMRWLHPVRVERLVLLNAAATLLWSIAAAATLWSGFPAPTWAAWVLALVGLYGLSLTLTWPLADTTRLGEE